MNNEKLPIFDSSLLASHLGIHDFAILADLYNEFLQQLRAFKQQLPFIDQADQQGMQELRRTCHRLKSSSLAVGALRLSDCLSLIDQGIKKHSPDVMSYLSLAELILGYTEKQIENELFRIGG